MKKTPVYWKRDRDKLYQRWTCPFCGESLSEVSPYYVGDLAEAHLWGHYDNEDESDVNEAIRNMIVWNESDDSMDEMLTKMVLDKL